MFGGYGTFGSLVSRGLAARGHSVVVTGRDGPRARAFAASLGPAHEGRDADARDLASCREVLRGAAVAVACAGPFSLVGDVLLEASLLEGCHYADIADDRAYARRVRDAGPRFAAAGLSAAYGCSSLPGLSGALALKAAETAGAPPREARVTLFIGNDNPKGAAAIESVLALLGREVPAPQGTLTGFGQPERIPLPPPFGPRRAYTFESPEYDLFPDLLGVTGVSVKVAFEKDVANRLFAALARLRIPLGPRAARLLARAVRGRGAWRDLGRSGPRGADPRGRTAPLGGPRRRQGRPADGRSPLRVRGGPPRPRARGTGRPPRLPGGPGRTSAGGGRPGRLPYGARVIPVTPVPEWTNVVVKHTRSKQPT